MKIQLSDNLKSQDILRRAGYGLVNDRFAKEESWSRRLGSAVYPRFHAYVSSQEINLHLDQKQASYKGYSAHGGEYDGEVVATEARRIIGIMEALIGGQTAALNPVPVKVKKGLWGRFLGV